MLPLNERLLNIKNNIVNRLTMKQLVAWSELKADNEPIRQQFVYLSRITKNKDLLRWSAIAIDLIDKR